MNVGHLRMVSTRNVTNPCSPGMLLDPLSQWSLLSRMHSTVTFLRTVATILALFFFFKKGKKYRKHKQSNVQSPVHVLV